MRIEVDPLDNGQRVNGGRNSLDMILADKIGVRIKDGEHDPPMGRVAPNVNGRANNNNGINQLKISSGVTPL